MGAFDTLKIQWADKADNQEQPGVLPQNKVVAGDINALKNSINSIVDILNQIKFVKRFNITAADFSGNNYQNAFLVGLTAMVDFNVYTNDGSGVLLRDQKDEYDEEYGYTFNSVLGKLALLQGNYLIEINVTPTL